MEAARSPSFRRHPMTGRFDRLHFLAPLGLAVATVLGVFFLAGFRVNLTASLPLGLYRVSPAGSLAVVCLRGEPARLAGERAYVPLGACPSRLAPLMKRVVAQAGDQVIVTAEGVIVNGRMLPESVPMATDSRGPPMPALTATAAYAHRLAAGELWLSSGYNAGSFDSRYFGPVTADQVRERLAPVWTMPSTRPW